jgi:hypothetical protein
MGNFTVRSTDNLSPDIHYFAQLTPTNHAGVVWVVCIISLSYALLCSSVRFILRRGMYSFDDAAILVSTLACIVQHTFVFIALGHGLGHASSTIDPKDREQLTDVSNPGQNKRWQLTPAPEQLYKACHILRGALYGQNLLDAFHSPLVPRPRTIQSDHMRHPTSYGARFWSY